MKIDWLINDVVDDDDDDDDDDNDDDDCDGQSCLWLLYICKIALIYFFSDYVFK